jgi:AsmA protein
MKGPLKWIAAIVGVFVLLVVSAAILLPIFIDPNDHKAEIIAQVKEHTGRDLRIDGDIELSVFPWIGVKLGKVELSNAAGFENPVFASTDKVSIRVKLLPLLSKRLEMDTVTIHGLNLNLARDGGGRNNWDDLARAGQAQGQGDTGSGASSSSGSTGSSDGSAAAALAIGGLDIDDANLTWHDAAKNQRLEVRKLNLQTGAISSGEPVDLSLSLDVRVGDPALDGHITAKGQLDYDQDRQLARVDDLRVEGEFSGETLPGGSARIALGADITHDGAGNTLVIEELALEAEDMKLTGEMRVANTHTVPEAKGSIRIAEFNPKKLHGVFSDVAIETRDPEALTRASLEATIEANPNQLFVEPLTVRLDDSTISGEMSVPDIENQVLRFELALDAIDADRYMAPEAAKPEDAASASGEASGGAAGTPGAAATGASEIPKETLRALDVIGQMNIGKLKASNLNLADVNARINAKDGLIRLNPVDAKLYDGTYAGNITVDARGERLKTSIDENLAGVLAGPLLKDLRGQDPITGKANVNIAMKSVGETADEVKKSLNGSADFVFTDGAINGVNVARMIREAYARIKGTKLPPEDAEQKTDFSEVRGSVHVSKGIATNNDFTMRTPLLRVNGKGTANLPAETVDYRVQATLVSTLKGQGGEELDDLVGIPIPIHVTGSAADPKYALDTEALAQALAKSKVQDVIEEKVGDDAVKGLLKGLLK